MATSKLTLFKIMRCHARAVVALLSNFVYRGIDFSSASALVFPSGQRCPARTSKSDSDKIFLVRGTFSAADGIIVGQRHRGCDESKTYVGNVVQIEVKISRDPNEMQSY